MAKKNCKKDAENTQLVEGKGITAQDSCFLAYLDILGFKEKVKQMSVEALKKLVADFTDTFRKTVNSSRMVPGGNGRDVGIKIGPGMEFRMVSDSIYVWIKNDDDCMKQFDNMIHIVNALLATGFEKRLPLRGVVTFGELFSGNIKTPCNVPPDLLFRDNDSLYGKAIVEAYELESRIDWSGAIVTPNAWAKVVGTHKKLRGKRPSDMFNRFPYFLWYDVPFKKGKGKAIAYNWNYFSKIDLSEEKIHNAFVGKYGVVDDAVKVKHDETIRFFEYTKRVAELCDRGLKSALPVPDTSYALSDLSIN